MTTDLKETLQGLTAELEKLRTEHPEEYSKLEAELIRTFEAYTTTAESILKEV